VHSRHACRSVVAPARVRRPRRLECNPPYRISMHVPLLDLKDQYAPLRADIERAIVEVCNSQRFILGPRVTELEEAVARYSGAAHGIGMSSGTDALLAALMALDVG